MSLAIYCPVCKKETMGQEKKIKLKIRTSEQITPTLKKAVVYCPCCFRKIVLSTHFETVTETHFWDDINVPLFSNKNQQPLLKKNEVL